MNLDKLEISPLNMRKQVDPADIEERAQSIKVHGLLQNLVAYPDPKKKDHLLVCAGGIRLLALKLLASRGEWEKDLDDGLIRLVSEDEAEEISLVENHNRSTPHPADEFEAFARLVKKGRTPLEVAARFGVEEKHVNRMLKLANVAPALLKIYRENPDVSLDQMMAMTVSSDHKKQLDVWNNARSHWDQQPEHLRSALTATKVALSSKLGKFVGVAAYEAAGGTSEPDLFTEEVYLPDGALVKQIALEKLDKRAQQLLKEGWAWATPRLEFGYQEESKFRTAQREYKGGKQEPWSDKVKSYAGAVVTIGHGGKLEATLGLYRPGDEKKAVSKTAADKKANGNVLPDAKPKKPAATGFTFAAIQRLQGFRTAVLRNELAVQPRVMIAALAADMAKRDLLRKYNESQLVHVGRHNWPNDKNVTAGIDAAEEQVDAFDALEEEWQMKLSAAKGDLFEWLLAQPEAVTLLLLSFLSARALVAAQTGDLKKDAGYAFQHTAGVDMTLHWKPTIAWLETLTKGVILQILGAFYSKKELEPVAKLGKGDLNKRAEQLLEGKGYLPAPLRPKGFNAVWGKKAP